MKNMIFKLKYKKCIRTNIGTQYQYFPGYKRDNWVSSTNNTVIDVTHLAKHPGVLDRTQGFSDVMLNQTIPCFTGPYRSHGSSHLITSVKRGQISKNTWTCIRRQVQHLYSFKRMDCINVLLYYTNNAFPKTCMA